MGAACKAQGGRDLPDATFGRPARRVLGQHGHGRGLPLLLLDLDELHHVFAPEQVLAVEDAAEPLEQDGAGRGHHVALAEHQHADVVRIGDHERAIERLVRAERQQVGRLPTREAAGRADAVQAPVAHRRQQPGQCLSQQRGQGLGKQTLE